MTDTISILGGQVLATDAPRTVRGLLLPYNEVGRTNVGLLMVEAGSLAIPSDPAAIGINLDHIRHDVVGRATALDEQPEGVYATIQYTDTVEGNAAYQDAISPTGKRRKLSAEFGPVKVAGGKLVAGVAKLWGGGMVEAGAFPSAMVLATDTPDEVIVPVAPAVVPTEGITNTPEGESTVAPEAAPIAPATAVAPVPATIPGAPQVLAAAPALEVVERPIDPHMVFAAIAAYKANPSDNEAYHVLAALTDITLTGTSPLPASNVVRPNWLGQVNKGSYVREYIDLGNHGTDISAGGKQGFKVGRGTTGSPIAGPAQTMLAETWLGDKNPINSYAGRTNLVSSSLRRFAVGNDIGREFYDLPGGAEVVESFISLLVEDYQYWSDMFSLLDLISAPAVAPIAPATYPSGSYPAAIGMLVQGILAVKARKADGRRDVPTFAIANDAAYAALVYAAGGDQMLPAFVNLAVSTASHGTIDGTVTIVQGDNGIVNTAAVTVGAEAAIDFDEISGGPLVINALEVAKGGLDRAVHGYLQTFNKRPEAFVTIGVADTRANSTVYPLGRLLLAGAVVYRVIGAGTSGGSAPTAPAVGATVADGTATLLRLV